MSNLTKQNKILKISLLSIGALLVIAATFFAARWVIGLRNPQQMAAFEALIESLGFRGWLLLLAIQYLQIVLAFIPGGPIQIVAGALFGPLGGILTCLLGTALASATVFWMVSRYGKKIVSILVGKKDIANYSFLNNETKLEKLVIILFLIPGTPKDALTYLFALTPIDLPRFLFLSMLARVPAMLTSVLAGDSIRNGQWLRAVFMFVMITLIALGGLFLHYKLMQKYKSSPKK